MTTANYCAPDVMVRCACGERVGITFDLFIEPADVIRQRVIQIHRCDTPIKEDDS